MRSRRKLFLVLLLAIAVYAWVSTLSVGPSSSVFRALGKWVYQLPFVSSDPLLITPHLSENYLDAAYYADHFQGDKSFFVIVSQAFTSFSGPSQQATKFRSLALSRRVRVLFEKKPLGQEFQDGAHWVFIADEFGKIFLGWVPRNILLYPKDFKLSNALGSRDLRYHKGHLNTDMKILENGRFVTSWQAKGHGLELKGKDTGQIYMAEDMIWARKDKQDFLYDFFILNLDNSIQHEYRFTRDFMYQELEGEVK